MAMLSNILGREDEDLWNQGRKALQQTTPPSAPTLSAPKADLYIALPVVSESCTPCGFYRDDFIQNFHETRLAKLYEKGLISCPIADLSRLKLLDERHLLCFPSAVVEVKHHKVTPSAREKCYCQAANASSSALSMLSTLSAYTHGSFSPQTVRPVVSFTFIGPEARVWITYISSRRQQDPINSRRQKDPINSRRQKGQLLLCEYVSERCLPHYLLIVLILSLSTDT